MRTRTSLRTAALLLLPSLVAMMAFAGCGETTNPPDTTTITDADAAALFAMAYGKQGGFLMMLGHAVDVSRGGQISGRTKRSGGVILRDTSVARTNTDSVAGKAYTFAADATYTYYYTNNAFFGQTNTWTPGNAAFIFKATARGSMSNPVIATTDSSGCDIQVNQTDTDNYNMQGHFGRGGTYTFVGSNKTYTGTIGTDGMPGVKVDRLTKVIVDSEAAGILAHIRGVDKDGKRVDIDGAFTMRPGQPVRLNVGGKTYIVDVEHGTAALQ